MGLCCCKEPVDEFTSANVSYATPIWTTQSAGAPVVRPPSLGHTNTFQFRDDLIGDSAPAQSIHDRPRRSVSARQSEAALLVPQVESQARKTGPSRAPILAQRQTLRKETPKRAAILTQQKVGPDKELLVALLKTLRTHHAPSVPLFGAYTLEHLDPKSETFVTQRLFGNQKFRSLYEITDAKRIWNPYLMAQYLINKERLGDEFVERHLYHGTSQHAAYCILTYNFDWRLVKEYWFGKGVYFANNPYYASHYSKKRQRGFHDHVMIVAKVLVEKGAIDTGDSDTAVPQSGHTTLSENGQEFIKYDDGCFYPEFIVNFRPLCDAIDQH